MMDFRGSGPIRIGVSACPLGQEVRFDGGHKRNDFLTGTLGDFVEFVAVCPEVDRLDRGYSQTCSLTAKFPLLKVVGEALAPPATCLFVGEYFMVRRWLGKAETSRARSITS
jgi:2-thiouracil desulfurase